MKRLIAVAALAMCGCGADLISVENATMRYDAPDYAGLERSEVSLRLAPGAEERIACVNVRCTSIAEGSSGVSLCVDTARSLEVSFGLRAHERCATAEGVLTHESGEQEPFAVELR